MSTQLKHLFIFLLAGFLFTSCEKELSEENGGTPTGVIGGTAVYTLAGSPGTCTVATVSGIYKVGKALDISNTITISVNVDTIGTYSISTNALNGISFTGTGAFITTGEQTITLSGTGTAVAAGAFTYAFGANGCSFSVTVSSDAIATGNFKAKIDGTQWVADRFAQGARINNLINISGLGLDKKALTISVKDSGVHQYTLAWDNTSGGAGAYMDSSLADVTAFTSNAGLAPSEGGGTLNITSIDEVNKKMSGTFSFKAKRFTDNTNRDISEGVFTDIPYITSLPPGNSTDTFTVKTDGTAFVPTLVSGLSVSILSNIVVQGTDGTGTKAVAVYFPNDIVPGTYAIGGIGDPHYGQYNVNASTFLLSSTGTLEILFHNPATKRIRGRFSFTASPLTGGSPIAQITEGYFSVTYL